MTFSEKLTILRKRRGLSQEQLAEMLDVSRQSVSKWEAQQTLPETSKIIIIGEIFNVSIDLLLRDEQSIEFEDAPKVILEPEIETVNEPIIIFCSKCGKENAIDSAFCGYCGNPFAHISESIEETKSTYNDTDLFTIQPATINFPAGFEFKKFCANCANKIGIFSRTKISNGMYLCDNCVSQCSNIIVSQLSHKTIVEVKNDIARMKLYPEFTPTHQFGRILFDANNKLWKAYQYPIFRFQDINDFEVVEERETQSISCTHQKTKTKGGLGRALVGGAMFGVAGAIVGGSTAKRKSVTIGSINTTNIDYFTKLGIKIMLNDMSVPSITVDFLCGRTLVSKSQKIIDDVNNALGFLNIVVKN